MKRLSPLLLTLLLALPAWGQSVKLPAEVRGDPGSFVRVAADTDGSHVRWLALDSGLSVFPSDLLKDSKTTVVVAQKPGKYRVAAWTAKGDVPSDAAICTVVIGTPPDPGPGPTPPDPPTPDPPAPISGKRVLIVYESGEASKMPEKQQQILYGRAVRDYLNGKCDVESDGKTRAWRIWDADVDASGESKTWQDALKRPRQSVPWVIISNGKTGFEGPLPATVEEFMALVKKHLD